MSIKVKLGSVLAVTRITVCAAAMFTTLAITATAASASSTLPANAVLHPGESLTSPDGRFNLVMQSDGNLVEYQGQSVLWNTATYNHPGAFLVMQGDGNAVVYGPSGGALWNSRTGGHASAAYHLELQGDANLVVYPPAGPAVWANYAKPVEYKVVGTGGTLAVRTAPSLSAPSVANLPDNTPIDIVCQTTGDTVVGSAIWDKIDRPAAGYVADWYTNTPAVGKYSPGLPICASAPTGLVGKLENARSARCLDADEGTIGAPGTKMQLWDCVAGPGNQNWLFAADGTIRNIQNGQCLDADTNTIGSYGTKVQLWPCNGGSNQRWTIAADGSIHNAYNQWCLDADGGAAIRTNGTPIQLWGCNHAYNQRWTRFAPNALVPSVCRTFPTKYASDFLAFGLNATICYNGTVVSPGPGAWAQPWCNALGTCSPLLGSTFGGGVQGGALTVNQTWHAKVGVPIPGLPPVIVCYEPTSHITVDRNGNDRSGSSPGTGVPSIQWCTGEV
jgi:hypothetical protein